MSEYRIRQLAPRDIGLCVDWAAAEGWNPGLHDAACFAAADATGFFAGCLNGEPVATISVVKYGATFAFLGLYIVAPAQRGRGYGLALWNHALATARGRNVGLDGVVAQQDNYTRSGFALAYRNIRYRGLRGSDAPLDARVVPLSRFRFEEIARYDRAFFPEARDAFLRAWIAQPGAKAMAVEQAGRMGGYGVIRPCRTGFKIGPLFAEDASCAEALFHALTMRVPAGSGIFLDVPEPNRAAIALAERHGMIPVFETARMYTGPAPRLPLTRLFGVATFELG
ncbi:MAG: GNAT family N-acetyltransferase [Burkholderiales bacterium]